MSSKEFTIKVGNNDNVPLVFENKEHEEYFDKLLEMKAFNEWCSEVDEEFIVNKITVQSVDMFGQRMGFVKWKGDITDKDGRVIPSIVFMRGASVGMLIVITCEEDKKQYTILTVQPRVPCGKYALEELPAGMLDQSGSFVGAAAKEMQEETGIVVKEKDLIDLTEKAFKGTKYQHVFPSAGGCDEKLRLFLFTTKMSKAKIQELEGKCTGVLEEGENIKLKIISLHELWRAAPDVKALSALCIYENLLARRELPIDHITGL